MATYSKLQEYKPEAESIVAWNGRDIQANNIAADEQMPVFLSVVGGRSVLPASVPDSAGKAPKRNVSSLVRDTE